MPNSKNFVLYLLVCLLGVGVIASDIALISKNKALRNSVSTISNLQEQNQALQSKLEEGSAQQQPQEAKTESPTQEEFEQMRTSIREQTHEALDKRIKEAKTEYEIDIFNAMKQRYDNIFNLSDQFRAAKDEERDAIRNAIADQWRALSQLYKDYEKYQWESLAKEFGIKNTDEFVKRAEEIQAGFGREEPSQ
jgi:hypothetical protein